MPVDDHHHFPEVPTVEEVNPYDRQSVLEARDQYYRETMVRWAEIGILRDKMKWCYRREGPNARESCRELVLQYIEFLKQEGGWVTAFKVPAPKS
ncbi:hypothetical protein DFJ74DRAFT_700726 [Hyaloraphidium curvatum]|nr:hypothetical protein DFJ74DRAFT_700726 [Hyaloraphidium curvatum]